MALTTAQTATGAALIAALLASGGGYEYLKKNPEVTLRGVLASCEKGDLTGIVCCEDVLKVDFAVGQIKPVMPLTEQNLKENVMPLTPKQQEQCGAVRPMFPDPLGTRAKEEADWDAKVAREKAAFIK